MSIWVLLGSVIALPLLILVVVESIVDMCCRARESVYKDYKQELEEGATHE